jgi:hypothetical protein
MNPGQEEPFPHGGDGPDEEVREGGRPDVGGQLAERVAVIRQAVARWEAGRREPVWPPPRTAPGRGDDKLRSVAVWKLEGYTNAEIAARLGRAPATVERKLRLIRDAWAKEVLP